MGPTSLLLFLSAMTIARMVQVVQGHPSLTGLWRTNLRQSHFHAEVAPFVAGLSLQQQGNKLKERILEARTLPKNSAPMEFVYTLDGTETKARVRSQDIWGAARWQGPALVLVWRVNQGGGRVGTLKRELLFSANGDTLTMRVYAPADEKQPDHVLVLTKEGGGK